MSATTAGGEAAPGVAIAGRVGRASRLAAGHPVGDEARHGLATGVVLAEDLGEEAPEGRDRVEDPVAVRDAVLVEGVVDPGLGQDVGEREAVVAREAGAKLLQVGHGIGCGGSGWYPSAGYSRSETEPAVSARFVGSDHG